MHGHARKGCLWGLNELRITRMDEEIVKWRRKDPEGDHLSLIVVKNLNLIPCLRFVNYIFEIISICNYY